MGDDIDFTGVIIRKTEMGIWFRGRTWESHEQVFLPSSQIAVVHRSVREGYKQGEVTITVPLWLAEREGMI